MPAYLDEDGQRLWQAFAGTRDCAQAAWQEFAAAKQAMRRSLKPGVASDPAVAARYHAAREQLNEAMADRRIATQAYHAHGRMLMARYLTRRTQR